MVLRDQGRLPGGGNIRTRVKTGNKPQGNLVVVVVVVAVGNVPGRGAALSLVCWRTEGQYSWPGEGQEKKCRDGWRLDRRG